MAISATKPPPGGLAAGVWPVLLARLAKFAVVSGLGLGLDVLAFCLLLGLGAAPFQANAAGASAAVTWVYFASVRRIFRYGGRSLRGRFAAYAAYQMAGIAAASWAVGGMVHLLGVQPLIAKLAVTPLTFLANYLFMAWLTRPGAER
jgi:putative flippase GtrA